ncbi:MAG: hypothetical protein FJ290_27695 [Planctomycetes bacterium]|nr:hypothetical protein [Planctomycetota bacterium]
MRRGNGRKRVAFVVIELLVVIAVIAVLLGLGYGVYRGARASARVATAESNLKQVGAAMELFFQKYGSYPVQGTNLVDALTPFVHNPDVFSHPVAEESKPGETLTFFYREPTIGEADSSKAYVTCLPCEDVLVILRTGGRVEHVDMGVAGQGAERIIKALTGEDQLRGDLNINPRNDDFLFQMDIGDGKGFSITRETLLASKGKFFYEGRAIMLIVDPKGNANENTIRINGEPWKLRNGVVYEISDAAMSVKLWNATLAGAAMGRWWITVNASAPIIREIGPGSSQVN